MLEQDQEWFSAMRQPETRLIEEIALKRFLGIARRPPLPDSPNLEEAEEYLWQWHDSWTRLPALLKLADRMDRAQWLQVLGNCCDCCDNIGRCRPQLRRLMPEKGPVLELMSNDEAKAHSALPDRLTIYRGCGPGNIRGASWSLDRKIAARFPILNRYE
jgi:hypothetical protein